MNRQAVAIAVGALGWLLFGLCWWASREPAMLPDPVVQEAVRDAVEHGWTEGTVAEPPEDAKPAYEPKHSRRVVTARGSAPPTEKKPPVVEESWPCETVKGQNGGGEMSPNWTLRPGDLGVQDWEYEARTIGDRPVGWFRATIVAQTPAGLVARVVEGEREETYLGPSVLPAAKWSEFVGRVTSWPSAEAGFAWGRAGRLGHEITGGYDFDRRDPYLAYAVRMPVGRR